LSEKFKVPDGFFNPTKQITFFKKHFYFYFLTIQILIAPDIA
jgi:hypothetical protein